MNTPAQIAKHFRQVYFGGNWTGVNLKDSLEGINWQQATTQLDSLNTMALLVFHIHYYVRAQLKVLQGGRLEAHDKLSFDMPPIASAEDWEKLVTTTLADAETFASLVELLPEEKIDLNFDDPKYGNYFRNLTGVIEHTHYHLGQIVLIKKLTKPEAEK